jgi:26S proteasome regulatory subunit N6
MDDPLTGTALKYMLLCKIMMDTPEDVPSLIHGKLAFRFAGSSDVHAILAVATAYSNRSLAHFEKVLQKYPQGMVHPG